MYFYKIVYSITYVFLLNKEKTAFPKRKSGIFSYSLFLGQFFDRLIQNARNQVVKGEVCKNTVESLV